MIAKNKNPFKIKGIAEDLAFFDRKEELSVLVRHALSGQHTLLIAPRRLGKSSLLRKVESILIEEHKTTVAYVDLFKCSTLSELVQLVGKEIIKSQKNVLSKLLANVKTGLPRVAPKIQLDPMGEVSFTITTEPPSVTLGYLEDLLVWFDENVSRRSNERNLLIFDELQEIVAIDPTGKIEKHMRAVIQRLKNTTVFYSGSLPSLLREMFFNKKRAFYQSAIRFDLGKAPLTDAKEYLKKVLSQHSEQKVPENLLSLLAELSQGHPYYVQLLGYFAWEIWLSQNMDWGKVSEEELLKRIFYQENITFESEISLLSHQQRQVFRAICRDERKQVTSQEFLRTHLLPGHSSVRKAVQKLEALGFIQKSTVGYEVSDPILKLWWAKI